LYHLFKIAASLAIKIYCRKTVAYFDSNFALDRPTIIACNHPNSFFDAINIAVQYPKSIYFLARGDAFKKPLVARFLKSLHLIPIYRLSEGKENLSKNTETFDACLTLLKQNQTILIFSEGICVNEWKLRPLKKGTARLALMALKDGINDLEIMPTNINYSSFSTNPKESIIHFNASFKPTDLPKSPESTFYNSFSEHLKSGILNKMVIKDDLNDANLFQTAHTSTTKLSKVLLAIPAFLGFLGNYWIYRIFKRMALKKTKNTVFYDSVLFGMLLLFYPMIIVLLSIVISVIFNFKIGLLFFIAMPVSAWCYKFYKSF